MKRIAIALALLLAAAAAQAQEARLPPCKLLTEADVKAALGGSWQVWQDLGSEEVCVFQSSPTAIVTLTLHHDPMGAEKMLEVQRQLAGESARPVEGLGPGAFRLQMSSANSLIFGKGQTVARVELANAVSTDAAVLEKLAQAAYARMP
jgi:hypothetical protein